jgi:hypothetical protein
MLNPVYAGNPKIAITNAPFLIPASSLLTPHFSLLTSHFLYRHHRVQVQRPVDVGELLAGAVQILVADLGLDLVLGDARG